MAARNAHIDTWYLRTANRIIDRPALVGEVRCDVAVLGAGYTGLQAALGLARRGFKVCVLEAGRVGWAASGRNGGQIVTGYARSMAEVEAAVGLDDARKLWALNEEAKALISETVAAEAIDCDLTWGYLFTALKQRQVADLHAMVDEWSGRYGHQELEILDTARTRDLVDSPRYIGALRDQGSGHLHPLNYALGLAEACERAGVTIYENSAVTAIDSGASPSMKTDAGLLRAGYLVLAGNALLGGLVPSIHNRIAPVGTYIAATEPLGPNRIKALLAENLAVCDMNFVLNYFRKSPDDRLLFGARVSYSGRDPSDLDQQMRTSMLRVFPQLADVTFETVWGGLVDITMNRLPHLGRLSPTTYFAQGFSGHGVALSGIAGRVIGEAVAGTAERFDVFARIPHHAFPGGAFRIPLLRLGMLWFRLRDLM
jgi:gamma-glutamylputrescine oxidase